MNDFITYPNNIDSAELSRIKNNFKLRDRSNSENRDDVLRRKRNPVLYFDSLSSPETLEKTTLRGLSYPLELDGQGGLKMSYGIDRIGEAMSEVFETKIGERIARPFMGTRDLMFETITEEAEAQSIKRQIINAIPYLREEDLYVSLSLSEDGTCYVSCRYSVEGISDVLVEYNYQPQ